MACNVAPVPAAKTTTAVVAAIDFGTTFSGYAWSFRHEQDRIFVSVWNGRGGSGGKVPTILLLEPDKTFHSFGYDAREKYVDLLEDEEDELAKEWYYFDRFKMKLYETKKLKRDVQLAAVNGRQLPAVEVFAIVIGHLKQELEKALKLAYAGAQPEDILWVLTVPAIWSDSAKQFMREAANTAGIDNTHLKLVLEPEAAALYCNSQKNCRVAKADGSFQMESLPEGHKYIVADLGGGTADLAVHEILPGGNLREIRRSDGDALGGNLVNKAFADFLQDVFGKNVIEIFDREHKGDVIELNEELEKKKSKLTKNKNEKFTFKLPTSTLSEIASQIDGGTLTEKTKAAQERYENKVSFKKDKMIIHSDLIELFFKTAVDGILVFIKKMREEDELNETNTLLLVGGFSESEYVKQMIQANNPGMKIIVPPEPSLSVLKGAVLMGHNPKTITERVARFTYGFSCARPFRNGTDPENFKNERGGQSLCKSVFKKMIEKGRVLKAGDTFEMPLVHVCTDLSDTQIVLSSVLYKSDDMNPQYTTEEYGCEEVGRVIEHPPKGGTADLAVHEILPGGNLREIRRSDGDALGGNLVNVAFANFLQDLFGKDVIELFDREHKGDIIEFNDDFEKKKQKFKKGMNDKFSFKLPKATLTEIVSQTGGSTLAEKAKAAQVKYENKVSFSKGDKLFIHSDIIETFFKAVIDGILSFIKKMREEDELNETNTLLLVGGFSESEYVKQMIQAKNPGMKIIVPPEPSLSVLKGAVLMGHNPKTITERVARFTYGFDCARPFQDGTDPENLKREDNGRILCTSVFEKMIEKGQVLKVGDTFGLPLLHRCTNIFDRFGMLTSILYKSEDKDPQYSKEEYGCEIAGAVLGFPPPGGWPPFAIIMDMLVVGETELNIVVMNTASDSVVEGKLDFL